MSSANVFNQMGRAISIKEAVTIPTTNVVAEIQGMDYSVIKSGSANVLLPNSDEGTSVRIVATGTVVVKTAAAVTIATLTSGQTALFIANATAGTWTYAVYSTTGAVVDTASATTLGNVYTTLTSAQMVIGIPQTAWREVGTGAVGNTAAGAGVLSSNTTPTVTPVNGATDPTQIITWASSNNDVLLATVPIPIEAQLALGATVSFNATIKSGGTTNAVGFTVGAFTPAGTDLGAAVATGTNQTTTYADVAAALDLSGGTQQGTKFLTVAITPAAHTTDTLVLKNAWLACSRRLLTS